LDLVNMPQENKLKINKANSVRALNQK